MWKKFYSLIKSKEYDYDFCKKLPEKDYPKVLKKIYKQKMGKSLNLENPQTFNEKIQWLKLYDNLPIKSVLSDKVKVIDWLKDKIALEHIKKIYQIKNSFSEMDFSVLPDAFVLKMNHGSKMQFLCRSKEKFLKKYEFHKKVFDAYMTQNYAFLQGLELQYKDIEPQIFAEEYIFGDDDLLHPNDIEIFCFNGIPRIILTRCHLRRVFVSLYDEFFKYIPYRLSNSPPPQIAVR